LRQANILKDIFRHLLAIALDQFRFVIEQIQVRWSARLK